jgi:hypothetical protein
MLSNETYKLQGLVNAGRWPEPAISSNRAPGTSRALSRTKWGGVASSSLPATNKEGALILVASPAKSASRIAVEVRYTIICVLWFNNFEHLQTAYSGEK